jgi:uncharacterized membrane protein YkvA (DUF1232 family)
VSALDWLLTALVAGVVLWLAFIGFLIGVGRYSEAKGLARFVPDCAVLFQRLARHPSVPRRRKLMVVAVAAYLAMPFDLVPDFIPVAGYLDDAVLLLFALRYFVRGSGPELIEELWPGPQESLRAVLSLSGTSRPGAPG